MVAIGEAARAGFGVASIFGPEPQLPPVGPKGDRAGAAAGAEGATVRAGPATGRAAWAGAADFVLTPLATPLSSSSIGSSRCA